MNKLYLYGRNPLKEALAKGHKGLLEHVYLTPAAETEASLVSALQKAELKHERVTENEIESMVGRDANHQGVCALVDDRKLYTSLEDALEKAWKDSERPLLVLLDELQDPHNVGAIIRTASAFGASAILMPEHDQVQITSTVMKTSAGAVFSIPIVRITNVNTTLRTLKDKGYWTYALEGTGDTKLHGTTFDTPVVIVVGNEGEGVRPKTLEVCDFKLSIDISKNVESLNASNAAAVTMYEWNRQQK
jgi:23S rRNA (guanosine2251-2'-O)-methyltransferase